MTDKIDFIILWLDDSDINWQREKAKYSGQKIDETNSKIRYRDWGLLKYWFRSVEKNAPWVNNIYFVTCGQKPEWLDESNPKLKLVNHEDFMPKEILPTFNSSSILMYLHKIKGLSEKFIIFNDDTFIVSKIDSTYFFENDLPKDALIFNAVSSEKQSNIINHVILNDLELIAQKVDKKEFIKNNKSKVYNLKYGKGLFRTLLLSPWKYYTGIYNPHVPIAFLKSSYDEIWNMFGEEISKVTKNRFRTKNDYNEWLVRYWQLLSGKFIPKSFSKDKYYDLANDNSAFLNNFVNGKYNMICLNDANPDLDFEKVKKELIDAFDKMYSNRSSFEKDNI